MTTEYRQARIQGIGDGQARIIFAGGEIWSDAAGKEYHCTIEEALRRVKEQDWTAPKQPKDGK